MKKNETMDVSKQETNSTMMSRLEEINKFEFFQAFCFDIFRLFDERNGISSIYNVLNDFARVQQDEEWDVHSKDEKKLKEKSKMSTTISK